MLRISRRLLLFGLPALARNSAPQTTAQNSAPQKDGASAPRGKPMIEIRRRVSFTTPQPVAVDPVPLRSGKIAARPPAPAEEAAFSVRHFANNSLNGRLSA